ncbi:MAG: hypothetical protein R6V44_03980 [Paracoccaceae bacterium]
MSAPALHLLSEASSPAPAPAAPALEGGRLATVERIRDWAAAARRGRAGDLDRACALVGAPGAALEDAHGAALLAALASGCRTPLRLHRRGDAASWDELWLIRLLERLAAGDEASARFLVARRCAPKAARRALFLAGRLAALAADAAG